MYIENIQFLMEALKEAQADDNVKSLMLFCSDKERDTDYHIQSILKINNKPLIGGIFPEFIADGVRRESGFLLISLEEMIETTLFESNGNDWNLKEDLEQWAEKHYSESCTVFCFFNSLWSHKKTFIETLYDSFGPMVHYLGGGAGSLSFQSKPSVFMDQAVAEHAAVVAVMKKPVSMGVAHGWYPISKAIKVTETRGNSIVSLDSQPAIDVYRKQIADHSNRYIETHNFFDIAKSYPLGLLQLDKEMLIRDPFAMDNGMLHIVDEVPEGEYVHIMHGNLESLLAGAQKAMNGLTGNPNVHHEKFCIDCISRVLFMQNDFDKELSVLNQHQKTNGILSIGEIANPGNSALHLFNKTVVAAKW